MSRGCFSEREAATVAECMLSALAHLHSAHVMHRDVKPENLLLMTPHTWEVKLSDFGLVKIFDESDPSHQTADDGDARPVDTNPYTFCGSSYYIAPEIMRRDPQYTSAVDLWSAGVVIYIMLCGQPPFEKTPVFEQWTVQFPEAWGWGSVSPAAKELIRSMLSLQAPSRCTAQQALASPWIQTLHTPTSTTPHGAALAPTVPQSMRRFNAKRKRSQTPKGGGVGFGGGGGGGGGTGALGGSGGGGGGTDVTHRARKLAHVEKSSSSSSSSR